MNRLPPLGFIPFLLLYCLTFGYLTIDYTSRRYDGSLFDVTLPGWQDSQLKGFLIIVGILSILVGMANYLV